MSSTKESPVATAPGVHLQVKNDLTSAPQAVTDPNGVASALQLSTGAAIVGDAASDAKLGVGIANPSYPLHVGSGKTARFELAGPDATHPASFSIGAPGDFCVDAVGIGGGRFIVKTGGNVGIGKSNPETKLDVNGTIQATGLSIQTLTIPKMPSDRNAPSTAKLQPVVIDTNTGTLYYYHG